MRVSWYIFHLSILLRSSNKYGKRNIYRIVSAIFWEHVKIYKKTNIPLATKVNECVSERKNRDIIILFLFTKKCTFSKHNVILLLDSTYNSFIFKKNNLAVSLKACENMLYMQINQFQLTYLSYLTRTEACFF